MEKNSLSTVNLKKEAAINGLIMAFISIVIFIVVYYVKPDLMASFTWAGISLLIGIGLAIYFTIDLKKKAGGFWKFKEALSTIFTMLLVSGLVVYFFTVVFGKFIEPEYPVKMKEIAMNNTEQMLSKMGMDQGAIDKAVRESEASMEAQFNPGFKDMLKSFAIIVIFSFIEALIFAAIFKKNPPVVYQRPDDIE